jgi:hypothetical protein
VCEEWLDGARKRLDEAVEKDAGQDPAEDV